MSTNRQPPLVELSATVGPPQALPDRVYGVLKYRILTCEILPGQRLNEQEIATELKVSRTPLREALNRLSQENLLTRIPYCGYAVTLVTEEDIRDLCESRLILETAASELAAARATPAEVEHMTQLVELRYVPGDRGTYAQYLNANSMFHRELARASHNRRLESMVMAVLDELQRPLYLGLDVGLDAESATREHVLLVEAIKGRDPARARQLQAEQIAKASDRMIVAMKAQNFKFDNS